MFHAVAKCSAWIPSGSQTSTTFSMALVLGEIVSASQRCGNLEGSSSAGANSPARSNLGCWVLGAIASSARLGNGAPQHLLCLSPAHTDSCPYQFRRAPTIATSMPCNSLRINVPLFTSAPGICCVTPAALSVWSHSHATRSTVVPTSQRVGLKANYWRALKL
ncbi:hypothetical protein BKA58DRAFT_154773 [Alternaria rosae]|uniref:uncharacterized protein n=1 Tax=Alternaria rosae TaxID=1187941 RepID=UPI001E8D2E83|nr:uncharacterized protein BKA58DRAFT_154773 [Alternaria rosae]KAH6872864.1 hypothetical protein BKA58DRAFT_154773 [Alternaria rosae]